MSNGRVCANANCHHTEDQHVSDMCWGKPKEIRKDGPTPGCRCNGFVARRDTTVFPPPPTPLPQALVDLLAGRPTGVQEPDVDVFAVDAREKRAKAHQQRWRFVSDDDGHDYLIPAEKEQEFNEWLSSVEDYEGEEPQEHTGPDFEEYRTIMSPNNYTFTDPKEDK